VASFPDYFKARFELASLYATLRRWNEAQAQLQASEAAPSVQAEFANQRGLLSLQRKDPTAAHTEFRKAIQLQEKATYWNNLGIANQQLGQTEDAQKSYQKALMLKPQYEECEANLSFLLIQQHEWTEAETHLQHVTSKNGHLWNARFALGVALENQQKVSEATTVYKTLLADAPANWPQRAEVEKRLADLTR